MKVSTWTLCFAGVAVAALSHDLPWFQFTAMSNLPLLAVTAAAVAMAVWSLSRSQGLPRATMRWSNQWALWLWLLTMLVVQFGVHRLTGITAMRLTGYVVVALLAYAAWPAMMIRNERIFASWQRVVVIAAAVMSITAALSNLGMDTLLGLQFSVKDHQAYRVLGVRASGGLTSHPLTLGALCFFGIGGGAYLWRRHRSPWTAMLIAVCVLGMLISMARGAWLATFVAACIWMAPRAMTRRRWVVLVGLPMMAAMLAWVGLAVAADVPLLSRMLRLEMGLSNRDILWAYGLVRVGQEPWFGYGFLESGRLISDAGLAWRLGLEDDAPFHNTFLDMAIFAGIPVTAAYAALFVGPVWGLAKRRHRSDITDETRRFLLAMTVGAIVLAFFQNYNVGGLRLPSLAMTVLLGAAHQATMRTVGPPTVAALTPDITEMTDAPDMPAEGSDHDDSDAAPIHIT